MAHTNPSHVALLAAIEYAGSQSALARLLGKSQPHIFKWLHSSNGVPPEHCAAIERATGGAVTRKDLRPNDWHLIWPELAEGAATATVRKKRPGKPRAEQEPRAHAQ